MAFLAKDMKESILNEEVTLKDGYWFVFDADGEELIINASAWSGREDFYVRGEKVASNRSLIKKNEPFRFTKGGHQYEVRIKTSDFLTSEWECTALKNGKIVGIASKAYYTGTPWQIFKKFLPLFLMGSGVGILFVSALVITLELSAEFARGFILGTTVSLLTALTVLILVKLLKRR
ncbi:hypothetical protein KFE96_00910 [Kordiimonas sp. SCSIO 12603]|uniref:hypothetical protein n=1 Tax=Kordiimonas sp. SCSIO 12603 TaxID=2829596 RepID=UPI002106E190|nr:hypothetical protein [Kordiimonas sp. SCSIO 12603]UTW58897.1 hypothetical protein KFE96_00910 [Kordiimonas sp. SCSIO 12603]